MLTTIRAVIRASVPILLGMGLEVMVMRIVTRFSTADQFVVAFRRFCTEYTCFIPSATQREIGVETGFSIRLADGTPMLRGLCVVLDAWSGSDNKYKRPGVLLGLRSMTAESRDVFARILKVPPPMPEAAKRPSAEDLETIEMPPLFADAAPDPAHVIPANPLTDLSEEALEAFVDCMMFQDAHVDEPAAPAPAPASSREPIATTLGVMPLRLTPVYHAPAPPLPVPPAQLASSSDQMPRASSRDLVESTQTMRAQLHWWSHIAFQFNRLRARVRRWFRGGRAAAELAPPRAMLPSVRGPRRARTKLAPLSARDVTPPAAPSPSATAG